MYFKKITPELRKRDNESWFSKQFNAFVDDFDIVAMNWNVYSGTERPYFIRILENGSKARPRMKERWYDGNTISEFHYELLDHGAWWKTRDGKVFCTGMPYNTAESATKLFEEIAKRYKFPDTIKFRVLDNKYKYRPNGYIMTMIYKEG